jgi:hypothetical protein
VPRSSKDTNPSPDIEDWIESAATLSQGPAWKSIPKEALEEIDRVLEHNDASPARAVPQTAMLKRLREVYKVKLTRAGLNHYLQTVLGRHWRR